MMTYEEVQHELSEAFVQIHEIVKRMVSEAEIYGEIRAGKGDYDNADVYESLNDLERLSKAMLRFYDKKMNEGLLGPEGPMSAEP